MGTLRGRTSLIAVLLTEVRGKEDCHVARLCPVMLAAMRTDGDRAGTSL